MKKTYQKKVLEIAGNYMDFLEDIGFFENYEIKNMFLVKDKLCDVFTEKFIIGEDLDDFSFNEDEWHKLLSEIVTKDVFDSLRKKGIVDSYEDENTEITYFLTKKGKEIYKSIKNIK